MAGALAAAVAAEAGAAEGAGVGAAVCAQATGAAASAAKAAKRARRQGFMRATVRAHAPRLGEGAVGGCAAMLGDIAPKKDIGCVDKMRIRVMPASCPRGQGLPSACLRGGRLPQMGGAGRGIVSSACAAMPPGR